MSIAAGRDLAVSPNVPSPLPEARSPSHDPVVGHRNILMTVAVEVGDANAVPGEVPAS